MQLEKPLDDRTGREIVFDRLKAEHSALCDRYDRHADIHDRLTQQLKATPWHRLRARWRLWREVNAAFRQAQKTALTATSVHAMAMRASPMNAMREQ
jgi:hypothetical protein